MIRNKKLSDRKLIVYKSYEERNLNLAGVVNFTTFIKFDVC